MKLVEFKWSFTDSSVPPPYHRSYDLIFREDSFSVQIHSYGDVLFERREKFDMPDFQQLLDSFHIKKLVHQVDKKGCTGGVSYSMEILRENEPSEKRYVYLCGGMKEGDLGGDVEKFDQYLKTQILPQFSAWMNQVK
jgi:hypothetical protein